MPAPSLEPVSAGPRPAVSIVMPTRGRAGMIAETLRTVAAQTFDDLEILVRSDGPDAATERAVRSIRDPRIQYSSEPAPRGMPALLNELIRLTRGVYILPLHDHDLFHPRLVEAMVTALAANPSAHFVHCAVEQIAADGRAIRAYVGDYAPLTAGGEWLRYMLSRFDCPVCAMSMVSRRTYEQHGLYDTDFGFVADVEMWMRLSRAGDIVYVPEVLMRLRVRDEDHAYRHVNWTAVDAILRIHARYLGDAPPRTWRVGPFAARAELFRLLQLLAALRSGRFSRQTRSAAGRYLRRCGGPLTATLARIALPQ